MHISRPPCHHKHVLRPCPLGAAFSLSRLHLQVTRNKRSDRNVADNPGDQPGARQGAPEGSHSAAANSSGGSGGRKFEETAASIIALPRPTWPVGGMSVHRPAATPAPLPPGVLALAQLQRLQQQVADLAQGLHAAHHANAQLSSRVEQLSAQLAQHISSNAAASSSNSDTSNEAVATTAVCSSSTADISLQTPPPVAATSSTVADSVYVAQYGGGNRSTETSSSTSAASSPAPAPHGLQEQPLSVTAAAMGGAKKDGSCFPTANIPSNSPAQPPSVASDSRTTSAADSAAGTEGAPVQPVIVRPLTPAAHRPVPASALVTPSRQLLTSIKACASVEAVQQLLMSHQLNSFQLLLLVQQLPRLVLQQQPPATRPVLRDVMLRATARLAPSVPSLTTSQTGALLCCCAALRLRPARTFTSQYLGAIQATIAQATASELAAALQALDVLGVRLPAHAVRRACGRLREAIALSSHGGSPRLLPRHGRKSGSGGNVPLPPVPVTRRLNTTEMLAAGAALAGLSGLARALSAESGETTVPGGHPLSPDAICHTIPAAAVPGAGNAAPGAGKDTSTSTVSAEGSSAAASSADRLTNVAARPTSSPTSGSLAALLEDIFDATNGRQLVAVPTPTLLLFLRRMSCLEASLQRARAPVEWLQAAAAALEPRLQGLTPAGLGMLAGSLTALRYDPAQSWATAFEAAAAARLQPLSAAPLTPPAPAGPDQAAPPPAGPRVASPAAGVQLAGKAHKQRGGSGPGSGGSGAAPPPSAGAASLGAAKPSGPRGTGMAEAAAHVLVALAAWRRSGGTPLVSAACGIVEADARGAHPSCPPALACSAVHASALLASQPMPGMAHFTALLTSMGLPADAAGIAPGATSAADMSPSQAAAAAAFSTSGRDSAGLLDAAASTQGLGSAGRLATAVMGWLQPQLPLLPSINLVALLDGLVTLQAGACARAQPQLEDALQALLAAGSAPGRLHEMSRAVRALPVSCTAAGRLLRHLSLAFTPAAAWATEQLGSGTSSQGKVTALVAGASGTPTVAGQLVEEALRELVRQLLSCVDEQVEALPVREVAQVAALCLHLDAAEVRHSSRGPGTLPPLEPPGFCSKLARVSAPHLAELSVPELLALVQWLPRAVARDHAELLREACMQLGPAQPEDGGDFVLAVRAAVAGRLTALSLWELAQLTDALVALEGCPGAHLACSSTTLCTQQDGQGHESVLAADQAVEGGIPCAEPAWGLALLRHSQHLLSRAASSSDPGENHGGGSNGGGGGGETCADAQATVSLVSSVFQLQLAPDARWLETAERILRTELAAGTPVQRDWSWRLTDMLQAFAGYKSCPDPALLEGSVRVLHGLLPTLPPERCAQAAYALRRLSVRVSAAFSCCLQEALQPRLAELPATSLVAVLLSLGEPGPLPRPRPAFVERLAAAAAELEDFSGTSDQLLVQAVEALSELQPRPSSRAPALLLSQYVSATVQAVQRMHAAAMASTGLLPQQAPIVPSLSVPHGKQAAAGNNSGSRRRQQPPSSPTSKRDGVGRKVGTGPLQASDVSLPLAPLQLRNVPHAHCRLLSVMGLMARSSYVPSDRRWLEAACSLVLSDAAHGAYTPQEAGLALWAVASLQAALNRLGDVPASWPLPQLVEVLYAASLHSRDVPLSWLEAAARKLPGRANILAPRELYAVILAFAAARPVPLGMPSPEPGTSQVQLPPEVGSELVRCALMGGTSASWRCPQGLRPEQVSVVLSAATVSGWPIPLALLETIAVEAAGTLPAPARRPDGSHLASDISSTGTTGSREAGGAAVSSSHQAGNEAAAPPHPAEPGTQPPVCADDPPASLAAATGPHRVRHAVPWSVTELAGLLCSFDALNFAPPRPHTRLAFAHAITNGAVELSAAAAAALLRIFVLWRPAPQLPGVPLEALPQDTHAEGRAAAQEADAEAGAAAAVGALSSRLRVLLSVDEQGGVLLPSSAADTQQLVADVMRAARLAADLADELLPVLCKGLAGRLARVAPQTSDAAAEGAAESSLRVAAPSATRPVEQLGVSFLLSLLADLGALNRADSAFGAALMDHLTGRAAELQRGELPQLLVNLRQAGFRVSRPLLAAIQTAAHSKLACMRAPELHALARAFIDAGVTPSDVAFLQDLSRFLEGRVTMELSPTQAADLLQFYMLVSTAGSVTRAQGSARGTSPAATAAGAAANGFRPREQLLQDLLQLAFEQVSALPASQLAPLCAAALQFLGSLPEPWREPLVSHSRTCLVAMPGEDVAQLVAVFRDLGLELDRGWFEELYAATSSMMDAALGHSSNEAVVQTVHTPETTDVHEEEAAVEAALAAGLGLPAHISRAGTAGSNSGADISSTGLSMRGVGAMNSKTLVTLMYAVSAYDTSASPGWMAKALEVLRPDLAAKQLSATSLSALATCVAALGKPAGVLPDEQWLDLYMEASRPVLPVLTPGEVFTMVHGVLSICSELGLRPPDEWIAGIVDACHSRRAGIEADAVVKALEAVVVWQYVPPPTWLADCWTDLKDAAPTLSDSLLSLAAQALAYFTGTQGPGNPQPPEAYPSGGVEALADALMAEVFARTGKFEATGVRGGATSRSSRAELLETAQVALARAMHSSA